MGPMILQTMLHFDGCGIVLLFRGRWMMKRPRQEGDSTRDVVRINISNRSLILCPFLSTTSILRMHKRRCSSCSLNVSRNRTQLRSASAATARAHSPLPGGASPRSIFPAARHTHLWNVFQRMGFERTTPVQQAAVPLLLQHKVWRVASDVASGV